MDLRGHITFWGAFVVIEFDCLWSLFERSTETKVTDFKSNLVPFSKDEDILEFEVTVSKPFRMEVGNALYELSERPAFESYFRLLLGDVVKETAAVGMLEHQDIGRLVLELLIGFITLKGNFLAVPETPHHISMPQTLQHFLLISQMSLFFGIPCPDYLQDDLVVP